MQTKEIKIGVLYAVGEGQHRDRHRGIVLSAEPHELRTRYQEGRQVARLQPDPEGRGVGRRGRFAASGERGLPVLLAVPPYRFDEQAHPEATDEQLQELAKRLIADGFTGDALTEDQRVFLGRQARLEVARPQAIERLWVDHQNIERRAREARQAESERRDRVRRLARIEHQRVVDLLDELGIDTRPPVDRDGGADYQTVVGRMPWRDLANLLAEVADAAIEPWRAVVADVLSQITDDDSPHMVGVENLRRMRELVGPVKFSEAYRGVTGTPEQITKLVQHVAAELDREPGGE